MTEDLGKGKKRQIQKKERNKLDIMIFFFF